MNEVPGEVLGNVLGDVSGGLVWVTAVNLVIWTGLCVWLVRLDRKVRALEGRS